MYLENKKIVWLGAISCWLVCVGDILVDRILSSQLPDYDFLRQTGSFLGRSANPTAPYFAAWGIALFILFVLFAIGWHRAFIPSSKQAGISASLLIIYGLGEGLGSGLIPFNKLNGHLTASGYFHEIFSGIGDVGLFLFPLLAMQLFPGSRFPFIRTYSWVVVVLGLLFNLLFLSGKVLGATDGLLSFAGLWQRLFVLDYLLYLMVMAGCMIKIQKS